MQVEFSNAIFNTLLIIWVGSFLAISLQKISKRIAETEVSFVLDILPNKMRKIDSDLDAGIIDDKEAKRRHKILDEDVENKRNLSLLSKFYKVDMRLQILVFIFISISSYFFFDLSSSSEITALVIGYFIICYCTFLLVSLSVSTIIIRVMDMYNQKY